MAHAKKIVGSVWILALAGAVFANSTLATLCNVVLAILVVAHAVECVVFLPKLRRAPGSLAGHLWQTFLFGVAHVGALPTDDGSAGSS